RDNRQRDRRNPRIGDASRPQDRLRPVTAVGNDARFVLPDGRVVEYWEGGNPTGRPMIMHPGTPATRWLGRWGHEAAASAGVRLVSLSRPGYGGSTMTTEGPSLLAWGKDTA